jgi:hypothetical protein
MAGGLSVCRLAFVLGWLVEPAGVLLSGGRQTGPGVIMCAVGTLLITIKAVRVGFLDNAARVEP